MDLKTTSWYQKAALSISAAPSVARRSDDPLPRVSLLLPGIKYGVIAV